jgi:signal transduction histidine kinase
MGDHSAGWEPGAPAHPREGTAPLPRHERAVAPSGAADRMPNPAAPVARRGDVRLLYLISLPIWASAVVRAADDTSGFDGPAGRVTAALLLTFVVLFVSAATFHRRFAWSLRLYLAIQTVIVPALMLVEPDVDYFAILYIPLCAQAMFVLARLEAIRWVGAFTGLMTIGLLATQDWPKSLTLVLLYGSGYFFVAAYAAARHRTETLLTELQEAFRRLETYATQIKALAVVEERNRLARDLHDSVTQALYGLTLCAEAARRQVAAGQIDAANGQLRDLGETAQRALQEMRLLIFELRPPVLEQEGLAAALQARLQTVEGRVGLATTLVVEGDRRLPPTVEAELDRIAQEALNNALKHARAHHIAVHLRQGEHTVSLEIADDGTGFDPTEARTRGGLGLRGMAERAARVDGHLAVESAPGRGARIRAEVPR